MNIYYLRGDVSSESLKRVLIVIQDKRVLGIKAIEKNSRGLQGSISLHLICSLARYMYATVAVDLSVSNAL